MRAAWALAFGLAVMVLSMRATAQIALEPQVGWNEGVHGHLDQGMFIRGTSIGPVLSGSWYVGSWSDSSRTRRFGMSLWTQRVKILRITDSPSDETRYHLTAVQGIFERAPLRGTLADLVLQLSIGVAWRTRAPDESGDWPLLLGAFSLGVKTIFPVAPSASITLCARGNLISADASTAYPFKSGTMFLAGVEIYGHP